MNDTSQRRHPVVDDAQSIRNLRRARDVAAQDGYLRSCRLHASDSSTGALGRLAAACQSEMPCAFRDHPLGYLETQRAEPASDQICSVNPDNRFLLVALDFSVRKTWYITDTPAQRDQVFHI